MAPKRPRGSEELATESAPSRGLMRWLIPGLLAVCLLASVLLGVGWFSARGENATLTQDLQAQTKKARSLQKKFSAQKAQLEELLRTRSLLAGEKGEAEQKLARLEGEVARLRSEHARLKAQAAASGARVTELSKALEAGKAREADLAGKLKTTEGSLAKLKKEKGSLEARLKSASGEIKSCRKNNAALTQIANELVARYKEKGVVKALLAKEPVTQIEKVELDRLTREYEEKIAQQRLEKGK